MSAAGRGSFPFRAAETAEAVPLIDQKIKRRLCAMLDVEYDIKTGLRQRLTKQLALAWAVFDQQDGGVRHHYKEEISAGKVSGSKMKKKIVE